MKYLKREWDELRGDEFDFWGTSMWYFELSNDNSVTRQIEVYKNGPSLKYDEQHTEDEYGALSDQPLDIEDDGYVVIDKAEFENIWSK